jgi:hypothetical protein
MIKNNKQDNIIIHPDKLNKLNKDKRLHNQQTKYFRLKTLQVWIYKMDDLFNCFDYIDERVVKLKECKKQLLSKEIKNHIIRHIGKYYLTENKVYDILNDIVKNHNINWYDLHNNQNIVRKYIFIKLLDAVNIGH